MLNQWLHSRLQEYYGEVRVANQGEHNHYYPPRGTPPRRKIAAAGEQYQVCCPFCGDGRFRMYFNHAVGTVDAVTDQAFSTDIWCCFNEYCHEDEDNRKAVREDLDAALAGMGFGTRPIHPATTITQFKSLAYEDLESIPLPDGRITIDELPDDHPAVQFVRDRGHDPKLLGKDWGVFYSGETGSVFGSNRLGVPFHYVDQVVGWQARYLGDCKNLYVCKSCQWTGRSDTRIGPCPNCDSEKVDKVPKWYTAKGTRKSKFFFNQLNAARWPWVIICEGPMDAIRVGTEDSPDMPGQGVAVFGHSLSKHQREILRTTHTWRAICLAFDSDVWEKTKSLATQLQRDLPDRLIVPVILPKGKDPGDLSHAELWDWIRKSEACARNQQEVVGTV